MFKQTISLEPSRLSSILSYSKVIWSILECIVSYRGKLRLIQSPDFFSQLSPSSCSIKKGLVLCTSCKETILLLPINEAFGGVKFTEIGFFIRMQKLFDPRYLLVKNSKNQVAFIFFIVKKL